MIKLITRLALAALTCFGALNAHANTAVFLPDSDSLLQQPPGLSVLGYEFVASTDVLVTALGMLDEGSDGLSSPHTITLWDDAGTALVQILVPLGGGNLDNGFRYLDINPLVLTADTKYVIGVTFFGGNQDGIAVGALPTDYVLDPVINILGGRSRIGSTGVPMTDTADIYFGPNFQFTPIPVPAAAWLMLSALGVLGLNRHRR